MKTQRDQFLDTLFEYAKEDKDIILLSVDMGAPSLDRWRSELPNQFFSMGISEQNAINVAAGLTRGGKKVFVYFMAIWVLRCFEQIRYSCALAGNPITIIGNGVGLGYAPAGPAHEPNEDVSVMKSLLGIEIWSPSSVAAVNEIVKICLENKKLNYIRLERKTHQTIESLKSSEPFNNINVYEFGNTSSSKSITVCSYGFIVGRVLDAAKAVEMYNPKIAIKVCDINKIFPLDLVDIEKITKYAKGILVVEEQSTTGSLGEYIAAKIALNASPIKIRLMHLPDSYIFQNGTRDQILDAHGLSSREIESGIKKMAAVPN